MFGPPDFGLGPQVFKSGKNGLSSPKGLRENNRVSSPEYIYNRFQKVSGRLVENPRTSSLHKILRTSDGRTDGRTPDGRMDGWTDGRTPPRTQNFQLYQKSF